MTTILKPISTAEITWLDGKPYAVSFDDIYFSSEGGLGEAQHVFVDGNQLIKRWQALSHEHEQHFVIAETGFGTGRNFLLAWMLWKKYAPISATLHYFSCEKYPLSRQDLSICLALWPELKEQATSLLAVYPPLIPGFHFLQFNEGAINLTLMLGDALDCYQELLVCGDVLVEKRLRETHVDAWFLDGFSPVKNPSMWSQQLFTTIGMLSKRDTTLATSTTAGVVKKGLRAAGFKVNKQVGFGCKRDMIVGCFDYLPPTHSERCTPWHVAPSSVVKVKKALVLGAGLAGCFTANALARRGWSVVLLDAHQGVGCGASGNQQAILFPYLSPFATPLSKFMLTSYLYAVRRYTQLLSQSPVGQLSGLLLLAYNHKQSISQDHLIRRWLAYYPELGVPVNAAEASVIAGVLLQSGGLFIPDSGWFDSPALCQLLSQTQGIHWEGNTPVTTLAYDGQEWHANDHHAEVLVIANGYHANMFKETKHLPIKAVRGQMTMMSTNEQSRLLNVPMCADGHMTPACDGIHGLGATYSPGDMSNDCSVEDDRKNLSKLDNFLTDVACSREVVGHWAGVRAATNDYLPLVGPVAKEELFGQQFSSLASDSKRWLPFPGVFHQGLYVCAGFGSRGLTTVPLSAEWLAATINKEPSCLSRTMMQSISPARFLRRDIIRVKK